MDDKARAQTLTRLRRGIAKIALKKLSKRVLPKGLAFPVRASKAAKRSLTRLLGFLYNANIADF